MRALGSSARMARVAVRPHRLDQSPSVDVPLDEVPAEATVRAHRAFEIDDMVRLQRAKRRDSRGLGTDIRVHRLPIDAADGKAHAVHGNAVSQL